MEHREFQENWKRLNKFVEVINEKVHQLIDHHENDFLKAFKHQMYKLQEELTILKMNMDERILREKRNKKILVLKKHLEYFRCQAVRLEKERIGYIDEIGKLRKELDAVKRDKKYFESFVIQARQENEKLKDHVRNLEVNHSKHLIDIAENNKTKIHQYVEDLKKIEIAPRHNPKRKPEVPKPLKVVNRAYSQNRKK